MLILDCCFSGRAIEAMTEPNSIVAGQIDITDVYTLTSASANQPANAPAGEKYTAFTGELLELLRRGVPGGEFITLQIYTNCSSPSMPEACQSPRGRNPAYAPGADRIGG